MGNLKRVSNFERERKKECDCRPETMVSHEIKTGMLVDLDLTAFDDLPFCSTNHTSNHAQQLPLNLRSMKKRISNALPSQRATPRKEDEDDPFGLRTLKKRPLPPPSIDCQQITPTEQLIRVDDDSPLLSDEVFHPKRNEDDGMDPLTDWTRLQMEAQSIAGTIRAKGTPTQRFLNLDNFSPVGNHSPLTLEENHPRENTRGSHWALVASSPENSPPRPLRLTASQDNVKENYDPIPMKTEPPAEMKSLSQKPPETRGRKVPFGHAKPPLRPRNVGGSRRETPGLSSSSRRMSSSMGALPGSKPVDRTAPPRLRLRAQPPPPPSQRNPLPTKPPLRRSMLVTPSVATPKPGSGTPVKATPRRSLLATPVQATPRRSMLATPTFSRPRPTSALPTPSTVTKSTPVIKSHLSVVKPQLRPKVLGGQLSSLTPRTTPMTGPRSTVSRTVASEVPPKTMARTKRRISGLPSPIRKNPQ